MHAPICNITTTTVDVQRLLCGSSCGILIQLVTRNQQKVLANAFLEQDIYTVIKDYGLVMLLNMINIIRNIRDLASSGHICFANLIK